MAPPTPSEGSTTMHQRPTPPTGPTVTTGRRRMARKALLAAS
ncbi:glycoside hydrolase family 5 protein, partial [Streptomyces sp. MBT67]|nr:glycoside hydrolase family 5 protein [Streptomyces sp. MBT67]